MKNFFFLVLGLICIVGSVFLFLTRSIDQGNFTRTIKINDTSILVEVADTQETLVRGLSGREVLRDGTGMLFIFKTPGIYGFWMKDMNFGIDIVWIDEEFRVVGVEKSVSPETFPQSFHPNKPVKYVLEVPSGFSEKNHIDMGTVVLLGI